MAFRSSTSALGSGGVNNVVINAPAGLASGDIILVAVDNQNGDTFTWPSGFQPTTTTSFANFSSTGASHGRAATWVTAWKLAGGGEPANYTIGVATGGAGFIKVVMGAWSGRATSPGTPIGTASTGNGTTPFALSVPITGYTAAAGDDVAVFIGLADTNTAGSWAISNSIGFTDQVDLNDVGTFRGGEINLSYINNISALSGPLVFTATGTSLVASAGGDTGAVVIPLPTGTVAPPPVPSRGPMPKQIYIMP